jgi:hypothetical protein
MAKTFTKAPKPGSRDAIEAFERGGPGHDTKSQTHIPTQTVEPTKRLSIDMPVSLHRRFKGACGKAGLTMVDEVLVLIEHRTGEIEKS